MNISFDFYLSKLPYFITEIGDGWHPACAEDDLECLLLHTEQRFLGDQREYWYQGYAPSGGKW